METPKSPEPTRVTSSSSNMSTNEGISEGTSNEFGISFDAFSGSPSKTSTLSMYKQENLTIRQSDEARIVAAVTNAASKAHNNNYGSIYSVKVDISQTGTLCIGVKDLPGNLMAVSMLKRVNGQKGPGELAGVKLGDIIFGVNFVATRHGSQTLLEILRAEGELKRKIVHLQCWRSNQLCSVPCPGATFRRADHVFTVGFGRFKSGVLTEWERWNFVEILLRHMLEEMKLRASLDTLNNSSSSGISSSSVSAAPTTPTNSSSSSTCFLSPTSASTSTAAATTTTTTTTTATPAAVGNTQAINKEQLQLLRAKQEEMIDIDRNILHAKSVRDTINIRIVNTKTIEDTVGYIIRVEDVETGLIWLVHKRYSDFYTLHKELQTNVCTELFNSNREGIVFPSNRINIHIRYDKLIDQRVVGLENYLRKCIQILLANVQTDISAARALRRIQIFLSVDKHIDCIHPPHIDDQRLLERIAYVALSDSNNLACQQVTNFLANIDLESYIESGNEHGFQPMLQLLSRAMNEMSDFMQTYYYDTMKTVLLSRKSDLDEDHVRLFVSRCIRRQVELSMFLPIRREVFKLIFPFIALQALKMQQALDILQEAPPSFFGINANIPHMKSLPKAVKAFKEVINAYIPSDQGLLLLHTANAVMSLYTECKLSRQQQPQQAMHLAAPTTPKTPSSISGATAAHPSSAAVASSASSSSSSSSSSSLSSSLRTDYDSFTSESAELSTSVMNWQRIHKSNSSVSSSSGRTTSTGSNGNSGGQHSTPPLSPPVTPAIEAQSSKDTSVQSNSTNNSISSSNAKLSSVATIKKPLDISRYSVKSPRSAAAAASAAASNDALSSGSMEVSANDDKIIATAEDEKAKRDSSLFDIGANIIEESEAHHTEFLEKAPAPVAVSADDFLPLFTYVMVKANMPQLTLAKELMVNLVTDEESYGESGYYLVTFEAAVHHITDLATAFTQFKEQEKESSNAATSSDA